MQNEISVWMRVKKWLRYVALGAFWAVAAVMVGLAAMVIIYGQNLPNYKDLATYAPPVATRLYAADGSLLIEYANERRVFIDYDSMPPQLINAFVAAEDQNFWHHPGIDVQGITRAAANNVIHLFGGPTRFSGASTITQQVAKNFFLNNDRTLSRKIKEMILALKLERAYSKQHIITLYLNQIFLGAHAYGVGSAALMYFNKPVNELTLSEAAFLASLPKAPNDTSRAVDRRNYVLRRMLSEGYITRVQMEAASAEPLNINSGFMGQMADDFQYFAEEVRRDLLNKIGHDTLYNDGLYIKTTINPDFQRAAARALKSALDGYNRGRTVRAQGALVAINPHTGRVLAMTGGYSFAESSFNRATQGYRQIGSTIKPFVYLGALAGGKYSPVSLLLDAPIVGIREGNQVWKPENYDKKFLGLVPLRLCLEQSRNVPTVRLVQSIGVANAIASAKQFGVYPADMAADNLSLALGAGETTLQKLTLGYAAFINGGYRHDAKLVDYVQDRYGKVIPVSDDTATPADQSMKWNDGLLPPAKPEKDAPLADPQSLYQVVSMMQGVVEMGTGKQARVPGYTIAGKTGTTNDVKDVWFVGMSHDLVVGVWMGYDIPKPMGTGAGSYIPASVFSQFMTVALAGQKDQPFSVPNGLNFVRVNRATGIAASNDPVGVIITEVFKPGQGPNSPTAFHQSTGGDSGNAVVGQVF
ncbi:MAG: PBP1A family penicillin-binding protein [Proteobacteria bacterium]|nr:PBP1A family penicillin-binding protein [Pseudomonadota bacterium]